MDTHIRPDGERYGRKRAQADRAHMIVPETLIESIDAVADPDTVAGPLLDTFWQSFDERRCSNLTPKGGGHGRLIASGLYSGSAAAGVDCPQRWPICSFIAVTGTIN